MKRASKYDVVISVAEEDKDIAKQIAAELEKRHIRYYYYEEKAAESWGEYIIHLTEATFGKHARYVLMITSKDFAKKYWSNIERQVAYASRGRNKPHILQLRLDETPIDGISMHMVHKDWQNNPVEIASILEKKIKAQKNTGIRNGIGYYLAAAILILMFLFYYHSEQPLLPPPPEKILVTMNDVSFKNNEADSSGKPHSFYISNTEVTVAQYSQYCISQKKPFPVQPASCYEDGPVVNVTWYEAQAFCRWMHGRLPTVEEWIYAAEAGHTDRYSGGTNAGKVAVYNRKKPSPVGSRAPNNLHIYDMTGNAAEWCENWSDSSSLWKSVKGGAFNSKISPINQLDINYPSQESPNIRKPYIGFRVVWDKK